MLLPVYFAQAFAAEKGIGFAEMPAPEKAAVGRKRGGVRRSEYAMFAAVDKGAFLLGVASPKHEYEVVAFAVQPADYGVGKFFSSFSPVRTGLVSAYGKNRIDEQYALLAPAFQPAGLRNRFAEVVSDFLEDINQRRRKRHAV